MNRPVQNLQILFRWADVEVDIQNFQNADARQKPVRHDAGDFRPGAIVGAAGRSRSVIVAVRLTHLDVVSNERLLPLCQSLELLRPRQLLDWHPLLAHRSLPFGEHTPQPGLPAEGETQSHRSR